MTIYLYLLDLGKNVNTKTIRNVITKFTNKSWSSEEIASTKKEVSHFFLNLREVSDLICSLINIS